jgi:anti-anti-sigma factor
MVNIEIEHRTSDETVAVASGIITAASLPVVVTVLIDLTTEDTHTVVLDCAAVTSLDGPGVELLADVTPLARTRGRRLVLRGPSAFLRRTIERSPFRDRVEIAVS